MCVSTHFFSTSGAGETAHVPKAHEPAETFKKSYMGTVFCHFVRGGSYGLQKHYENIYMYCFFSTSGVVRRVGTNIICLKNGIENNGR